MDSYTTHKYTNLQSISSTQHQEVCACGHIGATFNHIAYRYERDTKSRHKTYCKCGYFMGTESHSVVTDSPMKAHCTYCGEVFNPQNDFIIFKREEEYEDV